jgi:PAS domain S-box-containing protein
MAIGVEQTDTKVWMDIASRVAHTTAIEGGQERTGVQSDLGRVVDAIPGLVWSAGPDGSVDLLNRRWCEYTGLSVDGAYGQAWHCAIYPEDLPGLLERWRSILASGEPGEIEARIRRFDGKYRWFLIRAVPVRDEHCKVVRWSS